MDESKPIASLSSGLLARKGGARPAMRPEGQPMAEGAHGPVGIVDAADDIAQAQADLGWDDHGQEDDAAPNAPVAINGHHLNGFAATNGAMPEVLRQREDLAGRFDDDDAAGDEDDCEPAHHGSHLHLTPMTPASDAGERNGRSPAYDHGRRAAFTLRVDRERHLRLRLACTLQNRSAQQVVTEALDRLLEDMPGLEELARRARRH